MMEVGTSARYQASGADQTSEEEKTFQAAKYHEIIEILLSAGYFRARIAGLSEFDKVVGGLCWCITSSGEDLDVDILFQENSTIGQKIKLSETIVMALRKMHAHQIQGSDFPALFPVIVWLVKKFFENREATFAQLRKYAQFTFGKEYTMPDSLLGPLADERGSAMATLAQYFKPVRKFRRRFGLKLAEDARVHSCLLEYGDCVAQTIQGDDDEGMESVEEADSRRRGSPGSDARLSAFERKLRQAQREAEREEEELRKEQEQQMADLMQQMRSESGKTGVVSGSQVGQIVGLQSDQISSAEAGYDEILEEARRQLEEGGDRSAFGLQAAFKRQMEGLKKEIAAQASLVEAAHSESEAMKERLQAVTEEVNRCRAYNDRLIQETDKLTELEERSDKKAELSKLKELVLLNESLKSQEAQFKASCKRQLVRLQEELRLAEQGQTGSDESDEGSARLAEIENLYTKTMAKHARMRQLLANQNLHIASTTRLIDDIPTRTELIQYERRFSELYVQVALKLEETRKYYDFYNTLDSTREILKKQVKLLNSINDNFDTAMKSRGAKEEFLRQFEAINRGVEELYLSKTRNLEQKSIKLEQLKAHYQSLLDEQRRYFKAVKDFQEECTRNEILTAKLAEQGSQT